MLWDTAGQEEFDAITKAYYRGAQACVLAFSSTDRDSFDAASTWKMKVSLTRLFMSYRRPQRRYLTGAQPTRIVTKYLLDIHLTSVVSELQSGPVQLKSCKQINRDQESWPCNVFAYQEHYEAHLSQTLDCVVGQSSHFGWKKMLEGLLSYVPSFRGIVLCTVWTLVMSKQS